MIQALMVAWACLKCPGAPIGAECSLRPLTSGHVTRLLRQLCALAYHTADCPADAVLRPKTFRVGCSLPLMTHLGCGATNCSWNVLACRCWQCGVTTWSKQNVVTILKRSGLSEWFNRNSASWPARGSPWSLLIQGFVQAFSSARYECQSPCIGWELAGRSGWAEICAQAQIHYGSLLLIRAMLTICVLPVVLGRGRAAMPSPPQATGLRVDVSVSGVLLLK